MSAMDWLPFVEISWLAMCRSRGGLGVRTKRNYDMCASGDSDQPGAQGSCYTMLSAGPLNSYQVPI